MHLGWYLPAVTALAILAACPSQKTKEDCPAGQTKQGDRCVAQPLCEAGAALCGGLCCAPDQTCDAGTCHGRPCADTSACDAGATCKAGFCTTSDPACEFVPDKGPFAPRLAWRWEGSKTLPQYQDVLMTPVVVPLEPAGSGDRFTPPAVIFNAIRGDVGAAEEVPGVMRAVRGDDGADLWASDPAHLVNGLSGIAAGDLRGDGRMVLVTGRYSGGDLAQDGVVAFGPDGAFLWEVIGPRVRWGAPTIANLTGGPRAQVVVGATVIDADGKIVCQGAFGQGSNFMGPIAAVADVDLDAKPEIVAGNTVYDATCQPKPGWPARQPDGTIWDDGLVAVADFTGDPHPEIVVVAAGHVRLHDWQGKLLWGPVRLPGGGAGGPPTVADFDGDGKLEIGVASRSTYSVFRPFAGDPVLWSRPTQDHSDVTGSSVFDFEDDGRAEVVYGDECYTRVYDGRGGGVLFEAPNPSCTTHENPVIADVNRDGRAEIVVATNSVCNFQCPWGGQYGSAKGITVWKDLNDRWVSTRPMWNQHAYAVTNVEDDGRPPWPPVDHWRVPGLNAFRKNPIGDPNHAAPDLAADPLDVTIDPAGCPQALGLAVKVWNRGAVPVAAGVPVAFRADPGGALYGIARTRGSIRPGQFELVTLRVERPARTPIGLEVRIDDDATGRGVVGECDERNVVRVGDAFCPVGSL
jgi:hypothetical protein